MPVRDALRSSLVWGLLLAVGACGGRAGDTSAPGPTSTATSQGGSSGGATSLASGGSSSTGGLATAGGATLVTGGSSGCQVVYGDTPPTGLVLQDLCGNGTVEVGNGEQCDDGNQLSGDGCGSTCTVESHWVCPINCGTCRRIPLCGDGIVNGSEMCDDGNAVSGDDCSEDCQRVLPGPCQGSHCNEPSNCGDGMRQSGEECDSGPRNEDGRYNGCSTACTLNIHCGDGEVQYDEQCDLGGLNGECNGGFSGCSSDCTVYPPCGDGIVQLECGEICDDGVNSGLPGSCSTDCRTPFCGDGIVQYAIGEWCDEGIRNTDQFVYPYCDTHCRDLHTQ